MFGLKHSEETLTKMSAALKGKKNWLGKIHSDDSRKKISKSKKGISLPKFTTEHKLAISAALVGKNKGENKPLSTTIMVKNVLINESISYPSMRIAAQSLSIKHTVISNFISRKQLKPYKGKYIFQMI